MNTNRRLTNGTKEFYCKLRVYWTCAKSLWLLQKKKKKVNGHGKRKIERQGEGKGESEMRKGEKRKGGRRGDGKGRRGKLTKKCHKEGHAYTH